MGWKGGVFPWVQNSHRGVLAAPGAQGATVLGSQGQVQVTFFCLGAPYHFLGGKPPDPLSGGSRQGK